MSGYLDVGENESESVEEGDQEGPEGDGSEVVEDHPLGGGEEEVGLGELGVLVVSRAVEVPERRDSDVDELGAGNLGAISRGVLIKGKLLSRGREGTRPEKFLAHAGADQPEVRVL